MRRFRLLPILLAVTLTVSIAMSGCRNKATRLDSGGSETTSAGWPDTLRVATLYSPLSYFIYRDQPMGYDYDLLTQLTKDKGMHLDLKVAPSLNRAVEMLDSGLVDLIAYEVPITAEYKDLVIPAGPENTTYQVLVQPKSDSLITDVTQLVGRDVYVENDSKYMARMQNLDSELGGGINIHAIDKDTLITEDLIEMVSEGKIPLTVVDSDIARINKTYYNDLDVTMQLSYPQRSAWGVSPSTPWLADSITSWSKMEKPRMARAALLKRYFELSKNSSTQPNEPETLTFKNGVISPYDALFRRYAKDISWDWRLLAAQGHAESRFNPDARSWAGARGIMQIMPKTAQAYGVSIDEIADNNTNIKTATNIIKSLNDMFKSRVPDPTERNKFILAAYNAGPAHILDAIALAKKYGKDPTKWDGNVAEAILMKTNPQYYNDPVVKYGYCRGRETYAYVNKVMDYYNQAKAKVPQ
ncbi:MAG: lytic transglycosylase F [Candidatus Amulumruptor caecigallinarius]|nr:MAG: lytic transglycosylase F [Candidatus Amulumruptor caecigallinarius]